LLTQQAGYKAAADFFTTPMRVTPHSREASIQDPMAKGEQRSNKMTKKPKKENGPPKDSSGTSTRPTPPTTTVLPKGKLKNK
ncbi:hypothetical protein, partial [Variovorax sp. OV329]|uniref:hypothetical protein n=1 Tax=Variovorax sp. OV329 TaxID=1882825 RepID=UPI001C316142